MARHSRAHVLMTRCCLTLLLACNALSAQAAEPVADEPCDKPCIHVPATVKQGENVSIRISGFPRNSQVVIGIPGLGNLKTLYQSGPIDSFNLKLLETMPNSSFRIIARSVPMPDIVAETSISIHGGERRLPMLKALPLDPRDREVVVHAGMQSVHIIGDGWWPRIDRTARLIGQSPGAARTVELAGFLNGCQWLLGGSQQMPRGSPCDETKGEIDQHWSIKADTPAGLYRLELSDLWNTAKTENLVRIVANQPVPPEPPQPPKPPPQPPQPQPPDKPVCNPDLPKVWQPGCIDKPAPTPPVPPPPPAPPVGKKCDPNLPRLWQPGCVDDAKPDDGKKGQPVRCNPNMPRYAQPGCIDADSAPKPPSSVGQKCNPNVPNYAQPGCIP